ncbi:MAG: PKD domain-containing protein [Planctomycetes bacterium]|nr:PKD domain-containing protein [Planctomycetota bacterium]
MLSRLVPLVLCLLAALVHAQSPVETSFLGGLQLFGTPPAASLSFDLVVNSPTGLVLHGIECNLNTGAGTQGTLSVWTTPTGGTSVGNQQNAAAWSQVATASRTHSGGRTFFTLVPPVFLPAGPRGLLLHHVGMNPVYTNGATQVPPLPTSFATAEITLDASIARVRASLTTDPFGGTDAGLVRLPNVALHYVAGPRYAEFTATPVRGASPLQVNFQALVASNVSGGVQGVLWDFDADGQFDAFGNTPSWTFGCGDHTVTMTMVDLSGSLVVTKAAYVQTDLVTPSFRNDLVAPRTVQFTDTSSPPGQTFEWDLDGDGFTDSTAPSPTFVYPQECSESTVTLKVGRACRAPVQVTRKIAVASTLETTFTGGLFLPAGSTGGTVFFDLEVTNPFGITVCGLHTNVSAVAGTPLQVRVHQKPGTHVGAVANASSWRLVGTAPAVAAGNNQRTFVTLPTPIYFAAGVHGVGIEIHGASPFYSNVAADTSFASPDAVLRVGLAQAAPVFGPLATSPQFGPRLWNGALHYGTTQRNGAPGYGLIGAGCPGSLGVPGNRATSLPRLGTSVSLVIDRLPLDLGAIGFGEQRLSPAADLGVYGLPGCLAFLQPFVLVPLSGAANQASVSVSVPSTSSLVGAQLFVQALSFDPLLNAYGYATSDAAVLLVGQ